MVIVRVNSPIQIVKNPEILYQSIRKFKGFWKSKGEYYDNFSRDALFSEGHVYFVDSEESLVKLETKYPYRETVILPSQPSNISDFCIHQGHIIVLRANGSLTDVSKNKSSSVDGCEHWSALKAIGEYIVVSGFSNRLHENQLFLLDSNLRLISKIKDHHPQYNTPILHLCACTFQGQPYLFAGRPYTQIDLYSLRDHTLTQEASMDITERIDYPEIFDIALLGNEVFVTLVGSVRKLSIHASTNTNYDDKNTHISH